MMTILLALEAAKRIWYVNININSKECYFVVGKTGVLKVKTNVFVSFSCPFFLTLKRFTAVTP